MYYILLILVSLYILYMLHNTPETFILIPEDYGNAPKSCGDPIPFYTPISEQCEYEGADCVDAAGCGGVCTQNDPNTPNSGFYCSCYIPARLQADNFPIRLVRPNAFSFPITNV